MMRIRMPDFGICLTSFCSLKILGYISSSVKRSKEISSYHLPAAYYGPGTIQSILSVLICLILLWSRYSFTDEQTEAQRYWADRPMSNDCKRYSQAIWPYNWSPLTTVLHCHPARPPSSSDMSLRHSFPLSHPPSLQGRSGFLLLSLHFWVVKTGEYGQPDFPSFGNFRCLSFSDFCGGSENSRASLVAQLVKNPPAMRKTWVQSLGWKDALEKGKATHSSILAWRIPWTL